MTSHEMIARWFINDTVVRRLPAWQNTPSSRSGTRSTAGPCIGMPSDMGHDDAGYVLPELHLERHVVDADTTQRRTDCSSCARDERRACIDMVSPWPPGRLRGSGLVAAEPSEQKIVWRGDRLRGRRAHVAHRRCRRGARPTVPTRRARGARLGGGSDPRARHEGVDLGFGLNWQHCARVAFVGATFSYETFYQAIRRLVAGQKSPCGMW